MASESLTDKVTLVSTFWESKGASKECVSNKRGRVATFRDEEEGGGEGSELVGHDTGEVMYSLLGIQDWSKGSSLAGYVNPRCLVRWMLFKVSDLGSIT